MFKTIVQKSNAASSPARPARCSKLRIGLVVLSTLISVTFAVGCSSFSWHSAHIVERWSTSRDHLEIRATSYEGLGPIPLKLTYVFDYRTFPSDRWHELMSHRSDPTELPRDQVRFLSDDVAYCFMGQKYAVTRDGGQSWSVWDANALPTSRRGYISSVLVDADGKGAMEVKRPTDVGWTASTFKTSDYGQHWQE
jgi:hypothetical protein